MASLMSLMAFSTIEGSIIQTVIALVFLILSIIYPVIYIVSLILYVKFKFKPYKLMALYAPFVHLLLSLLFFTIWTMFG